MTNVVTHNQSPSITGHAPKSNPTGIIIVESINALTAVWSHLFGAFVSWSEIPWRSLVAFEEALALASNPWVVSHLCYFKLGWNWRVDSHKSRMCTSAQSFTLTWKIWPRLHGNVAVRTTLQHDKPESVIPVTPPNMGWLHQPTADHALFLLDAIQPPCSCFICRYLGNWFAKTVLITGHWLRG